MSKSKAFSLGGMSLPLDIDAVLEEAEAQPLALGTGPVAFDFGFRFVRFAGRLEQSASGVQLKLVGDLGPMPYSAESPAARSGLARIVDAGNSVLGAGSFRLAQGRILLGGELGVPMPVSAVGLVSAVTRFLVPATPYMELISMYIRPPLAPARPGESAVRPEWRKSKRR
ncbi:hypothetical protein [Paramagnetospirillum magneticum]|uniref:Uncharacterized protein n=1 Tax=Paramagnetospirillum magneticum (strain ATCC 700264 / AMB-1) TaxID=342108 RepID=Q2W9R6_PARM1|nr:hypothetical protein [Paramagnetospirillum magneticum]BAE49409.1 hypothetical protein amb0605 [Paramagnetospirillum magneticum AMB-1]